MQPFIWLGIVFCITQSAMFSGLNLAFFSVSRLRLELEVKHGNKYAGRVLEMRKDSNFLLTTILWANVGINVLLTMLADSVLAGVSAFIFSTVIITFLGEIIPQAYFSRFALRMACMLTPVLRVYQVLLFPVTKPTAVVLDLWLGEEGIRYFQEEDVQELIRMHMDATDTTGIDNVEGLGAINFLQIADSPVCGEGELIEPSSIVKLPWKNNEPVFPEITRSADDPFVQSIRASGENWVVITNEDGDPERVLDVDRFLRDVLFGQGTLDPRKQCVKPVIVTNPGTRLGEVIPLIRTNTSQPGDVLDRDIILYWAEQKRIVTGSDVLGRLLRGIAEKG